MQKTTEGLIDTTHTLLNEAQAAEKKTQAEIILKARNNFPVIFKKTTKNSPFIGKVTQLCSLFVRSVTPNLDSFLKETEKARQICETLVIFMQANIISNSVTQELSALMISFQFNDFSNLKIYPGTKQFEPFFKLFFSLPQFVVPFESLGGLLGLWELLLNPNKSYLSGVVFPEITKTIHLYFQSENTEPAVAFLLHIKSTFLKVPESNSILAFQFLYDLFFNSKPLLLSKFIEINGFKTINQYIIENNNPQHIIFYQMFRPMCTEMPPNALDKVHPILGELISLIIQNRMEKLNDKNDDESSQNYKSIQFSALTQLNEAIRQFPANQCPLQTANFNELANSFKNLTDSESDSVFLLVKIFISLSTNFDNFTPVSCIASLSSILSYNLVMKYDSTALFQVIKSKIGDVKFVPYSLYFFNSLTSSIKVDEFEAFLKKYPIALQLLNSCFFSASVVSGTKNGPAMNEHLLHLIFSISPMLNTKELSLFSLILRYIPNIHLLLSFLQKAEDKNVIIFLLKVIAHVMHCSSKHQKIFIKSRCLMKLAKVDAPPGLIFDIMVALSGSHFSVGLDKDVYTFLKSVNFYKMPTESIQKVAFGIFQNSIIPVTNGHLVFPSILGYCGNFTINHPYDLWLCGQYGIEKWLEDTGKTIDQFPHIEIVAQRFLLPKHVQNFFEFPKLFSESCKDTFGSTPLFEFPKDMVSTQITIPVSPDNRSVSFWFFVKEYPPSPQNICKFNNMSFFADGDELFMNKHMLTDYPLNRWFHVVLTVVDKNNGAIYLDSKLVYNVPNINDSSNNNSIIFGTDKSNMGYWFLGGCIRVFKTNINQKIVERIFSQGVQSLIKFEEKTHIETMLVSPSTFIDLFGDPKHSEGLLSENSRPVISFSFLSHISRAYNGGTCALNLIFKRLQQEEKKIEECSYLLDALCSMQKFGFSRWAPNVFAVRMSAIFLLCPELFDSDSFTNVLSCFTSDLDDTIMWDSILTFLFDFGLFNSNHRSFIISKMFEYVAQFSIDKNISTTMSHFIFHVLKLVDCDESDSGALLALIEKIKPDPNTIATLIASYPNFKENFSNPSFKYKPDFDGVVYQSLFDYLLRNNDEFNHYYLIYVLPPLDSFKLISKLLVRKKTVLSNDEKFKLLSYCMTKTSMKESWPIIISLLTNTNGENITNAKIDFYYYFYIFLSFLGIHALNEKSDPFWSKLWTKMIKIAANTINGISELDMNVTFSLDQLLSFGLFTTYMCPFPYSPSIKDPKEVANYALKKGQPFPDDPIDKNDKTILTFQPTTESTVNEDARNKIIELIPDKRYLFPPNSNKFITCHKDKYTTSFIGNATAQNSSKEWNNWISLLPQAKFTPEELHKSNYMKDSIVLVSKILVHFISKPDSFKATFVHLIISHGLVDSKHSLFVWRSLFKEICTQCISKSAFEPFIINFSCFAIGEGWLKGKIVESFKLMLDLIKKVDASVTRSLNSYLIFSFSLVQKNQIPDLLKLLVDYQSILFSKKNLENQYFTFMLFDIIKTYVEEFKQPVIRVCEILINSLPQLINTKDEKSEDNSYYKFMIIALKKLCQEGIPGFNQLAFDEPELETVFSEKFNEIKNTFDSGTEEDVTSHLTTNSTRRIKLASLFFKIGDEITQTINESFMMNISIASVFRYHERMMLLFDEEFFLRIRERLLTAHQYFKLSLTQTKTLSLLCDPIYPTRRLEKSPMLYKIPPFPAVGVTDISPDIPNVEDQLTILPSLITEQLSIDYIPYEILMMHSPNQLNLTFSYHFEIDDCFLLTILQNLVNNGGQPFKLIKNISLLYGLDPLSGCLLMNDQFIFFVEGLSLTENGVRFTTADNQMPNPLYTFYISYFISGYFGQCFLFSGHPILQLSKSLIVSSVPHFWLQKPISIELNFLFGWSFILIANSTDDFNQVSSYIDETIEENYNHVFPPIPYSKMNLSSNSMMKQISQTCPVSILSPIKSGKLIKLQIKDIVKEWSYSMNNNNCNNKYNKDIDNFTYLCILNKLGSRSFIDFSQYYVFPWIFAEYRKEESNVDLLPLRNLSLPMGQIGPNRLERFDSVFEDSGNQYFYGTHYMHLGVVLFYLFRNDPFCLFSIYFNHGYDHPNRVFHEIAEAWNSAALMSPADVKEMVPQMFCVPEFLTNTSSLPLTSTTQGKPVDNVTLSNWASNPRDFTFKQRKEFESEKVSIHINEWIDLIFGFKSRGPAAVAAKNVYQPLCYQPTNPNTGYNSFDDTIDLEAATTYIINFGQCAKQLFTSPHLIRTSFLTKNDETSNENGESASVDNNNEINESLDGWMKVHLMSDPSKVTLQKLNNKEFLWPVCDIVISNASSPNSSSTTIFTATIKNKILFNTFISYSSQRASMLKSPIKSESNDSSNTPASSSLINETSSKKNDSTKIFNAVTSIDFFELSPDGAVVALFQKEGSFIVFTLKYEKGEVTGGTFQMRFQTLSNVSSAAISTAHFIVIAACGETVQRFDLGLQSEVEPINAGFIVRKVAIDDKAALIIVAGDHEIAIYSISGTLITKTETQKAAETKKVAETQKAGETKKAAETKKDAETQKADETPKTAESPNAAAEPNKASETADSTDDKQVMRTKSNPVGAAKKPIKRRRIINKSLPDFSVTAIATTNLDEYVNNRFFVTGHANGVINFWSINFTSNELYVLKSFNAFASQSPEQSKAVIKIAVDDEAKRVVAVSSSEMVSFDFCGSDSIDLKKTYAAECYNCGEALNSKTAKVCSYCRRFYCAKCEIQSQNKQTLFQGKSRSLCKNCSALLNK